MAKVMSNKDFNNNELQNARIQPVAADPSGLGANNSGRPWFNTGDGRMKVWNGAGVDNLTNIIEAVSPADSAVSAALAGKTVTVGVASASGSQRGTQSPAHFSLLDAATAASTANALVRRDASGNFSAGTITASLSGQVTLPADPSAAMHAVTKQYADSISAAAEKLANKSSSAAPVANGYIGADSNGRIDPALIYGAGSGTQGTIRLAGDLGGTSTAPTVPGLATKAPTASPVFTGTVTLPGDPTNDLHAATKRYVDGVATGLDTKASVVYATAAALPAYTATSTTLTASANGALSVDGQAVTAGQRILVKNESTAANNGIYVVTNAGSGSAAFVLTRASDADSSAEVSGGMFTFVEAGSTNQTTTWVLTGTGAFTVGTTPQNFSQFGGGSTYSNGNGLDLTGNVFSVRGTNNRIAVSASGVDIASNYVGQSSITTLGTVTTGTWQGSTVGLAYGGTGATTAAGAKSNLGFATANAIDIPAGTSYTWTHGLGTADIVVMVIEKSTGNVVECDVTGITSSQLVVGFGSAVAANAYRIVAIGR